MAFGYEGNSGFPGQGSPGTAYLVGDTRFGIGRFPASEAERLRPGTAPDFDWGPFMQNFSGDILDQSQPKASRSRPQGRTVAPTAFARPRFGIPVGRTSAENAGTIAIGSLGMQHTFANDSPYAQIVQRIGNSGVNAGEAFRNLFGIRTESYRDITESMDQALTNTMTYLSRGRAVTREQWDDLLPTAIEIVANDLIGAGTPAEGGGADVLSPDFLTDLLASLTNLNVPADVPAVEDPGSNFSLNPAYQQYSYGTGVY